jgi:phosphatidylserine/phosphatidylglycerophosphate/cardiolipin synthase-like enzyme
MGIIRAMKTVETKTPETTKEKIINLLQRAKEHVCMSSGLYPEFYNDLDVKNAMIDAFGRVERIRILIDGDAKERKNRLGWIFEEAKKPEKKLQIKQCEGVLHWLIIDGKHFRLEKSHPVGVVGVKNLVVYDVDQPAISKLLQRKFDEWWTIASSVDP